jgi:hypothetical protein
MAAQWLRNFSLRGTILGVTVIAAKAWQFSLSPAGCVRVFLFVSRMAASAPAAGKGNGKDKGAADASAIGAVASFLILVSGADGKDKPFFAEIATELVNKGVRSSADSACVDFADLQLPEGCLNFGQRCACLRGCILRDGIRVCSRGRSHLRRAIEKATSDFRASNSASGSSPAAATAGVAEVLPTEAASPFTCETLFLCAIRAGR